MCVSHTKVAPGSAHALALYITRRFGGVNDRFTEKDMLEILLKNAGGRKKINKEEFLNALEQESRRSYLQKIVVSNRNSRPITRTHD